MIYRQLLKATNKYVKNQKFKTYLKLFYRQNRQSVIKPESIKAWINLLSQIQKIRTQKLQAEKVEERVNLNSLFIKHQVVSLSEQEYRKLSNETQLQNAYNVYMMCQVYYLWREKKIFGKKVANSYTEMETFMKRPKTFQIDNEQNIVFV